MQIHFTGKRKALVNAPVTSRYAAEFDGKQKPYIFGFSCYADETDGGKPRMYRVGMTRAEAIEFAEYVSKATGQVSAYPMPVYDK